ncbi:ParB/RepB/Spo0J family partition protein [Streptomyces sp. NPDC059070]|uniref:ParB/RepB/Spo0J family partition protein n=1 Tax=Streptomyces sp. NPDC059070 TaxID=3346713 RepID=UPI0036B92EF7
MLGGVPTEASLEKVAPNPANPRESLDEEYIAQLAENMRQVGQIQPATVMTRVAFLIANPEYRDAVPTVADFVLLDGHCRLAAAKSAGLQRLKIAPDDSAAGTPEDILTAALSANHFRKDLSYIEEARALEVLVTYHGSASAVAEALGGKLNTSWISQRRALLALPEDIQERVDAREIPLEIARAAGHKDPQEQRAFVETKLAEREVARAQKARHRGRAATAVDGQGDAVAPAATDVYAVNDSDPSGARQLPSARPSAASALEEGAAPLGADAHAPLDWSSPGAVALAIRARMGVEKARQVARELLDGFAAGV